MNGLLAYRLEELQIIARILFRRSLRISLAVTLLLLVIVLWKKILETGHAAKWNVPPVHRGLWCFLWIAPFCAKSRLFDGFGAEGRMVYWVSCLENQPLIQIIYFSVVLFLLLRRYGRANRLRRWINRREVFADEAGIFRMALQKSGLRRKGIRVLLSEKISSPCSFGIRRPVILLPANYADKYDSRELFLVFLHELIHIKAGDLLWYRLMALLGDLLWFNPFIRMGSRRFVQDTEKRCDFYVLNLAGGLEDQKQRYGMVLLKTLGSCPAGEKTLTAGLHDGENIKDRIEAILRFYGMGKVSLFYRRAPAVLLAIILCVASAGFSSTPTDLYRIKAIYVSDCLDPAAYNWREELKGIEIEQESIIIDWRSLRTTFLRSGEGLKNIWLYIDLYESKEAFVCCTRKIPIDDPAGYYGENYRERKDGRAQIQLYENPIEKYIQLIIKYL